MLKVFNFYTFYPGSRETIFIVEKYNYRYFIENVVNYIYNLIWKVVTTEYFQK